VRRLNTVLSHLKTMIMKKLFTFLLTVGSFTAVFAQDHRGNDRDNNRNSSRYEQPRNNDVAYNNPQSRGYGNNTVYSNHAPASRPGNDWERQQELDRMNRDYDRRITDYRNDRSLSSYERNRRINDVERERKEKSGSFAKGAVVGGIAGVLLGVLLSK
jgi:Ni/Co efflux regulator RcnB